MCGSYLYNYIYTAVNSTVNLIYSFIIYLPQIPYPPDPDVYIGNYSCIVFHDITANIYSKDDMLLVDFSLTDGTNYFHYTAILKYYQALELQVYFLFIWRVNSLK